MVTSRFLPRSRKRKRQRSTKKSTNMANHIEAIKMGGPGMPARPVAVSKAQVRRRLLVDRLAQRLVTLGGVAIIASILAILLVIVAEVYPLFGKPVATAVGAIAAPLN